MTFRAGTLLGTYEIVGPLGAGGMGEVYRARDSKLKREVAIKILPEAFSRDPDRIARFQREAEVLASLNHPKVAAIYDIVDAGSYRFLVIELVEGITLADRIRSGPLPVAEAAGIARQIAEALEAAHTKGFVHRDLKPANVKITPDGIVKVLDFGLAKILDPQAASADFSNSPTMVSGTMAGVILGTAAYMSPEQARGQGADPQSDIWAFGCVLYEMLTGNQTFTGETLTDVLGGIVRGEPDWAALPDDTPPLIRLLLRQCLQKNRDVRLHHIGDARIQIDAAMSVPEPADAIAARGSVSRPSWLWIGAGALLVLIAVLALFSAGYFRPGTTEAGSMRFLIPPPENASFNSAGGINAPYASISPDGRQIAFLARTEGIGIRIWIRALDSIEARPLEGTEGVAAYPIFWSPDNYSIGFAQQGNLRRINVAGGSPQTICAAPGYRAGTWNRDGVIVFDPGELGPLMRVPDGGGKPEPVTTLDSSRQEVGHAWPYFLPDGDHFLYLGRSSNSDNDAIFAGALSSRKTTLLVQARSRMAYDRVGFLLFVNERSLMAQPFDAEKLRVTGPAIPIASQIRYNGIPIAEGQASLTVSDNGVLVYRVGGSEENRLTWVNRSGKSPVDVGEVSAYRNPELSLDDTQIAVERMDPKATNQDIATVEVRRGISTRVTTNPGFDQFPLFSPDGARILFRRTGLYTAQSNGTGLEEQILNADASPMDWSSDNRFIVYGLAEQSEIWALPLFGDRIPFLYLPKSEFSRTRAQFSPDGRWLAYQSNESGKAEIYVQSFPNPSLLKLPISKGGGVSPRWCCGGKELFYLNGSKLVSVEMRVSGSTLIPSAPAALFDLPRLGGAGGPVRQQYDVSQDGRRFLLNTVNGEGSIDTPLTVVVNWSSGLKK